MNKDKRKIKPVKHHPGIYRILTYDVASQKWTEPQRGNKYLAVVPMVVNGKYKKLKRSFMTFVEAKEFRFNKTASAKELERRKQTMSNEMTFKELTDRWTKDVLPHREVSTQCRYRRYLKHFVFFNEMTVSSINPSTIDEWIALLKRPEYLAAGNATRCDYEHEFGILKGILAFYQDRFNRHYLLPFVKGHLKMLKVREKPRRSKDLSLPQFSAFLETLKKRVMNTPNEMIYYLAKLQYGIYGRTQEAAALKVEDFDLVNMRVTVQRKVVWPRGKNLPSFFKDGLKASSSKTLPLSEYAAAVLKEWTLRSGIRTGYLFSVNGKPIEYRQIQYRYTQALEDAGLPFTATYILRHASLSEHYKTGKDIVATKAAAGHSDLASTQRYVKTRDEDLRNIQISLDKRMSESVGS